MKTTILSAFKAATAALTLAVIASVPAEAQQNLRLAAEQGAILALSAPLDITATQSWQRSEGRVDSARLLRPEGRVTNRSRHEVTLALFVVPLDQQLVQQLVSARQSNSLRFSTAPGATRIADGDRALVDRVVPATEAVGEEAYVVRVNVEPDAYGTWPLGISFTSAGGAKANRVARSGTP